VLDVPLIRHVMNAVCHSGMPSRSIDVRSPVPAYQQLAAILRAQIETGELAADMPLPSETSLVQEFGVARGTVRRAIEVLRDAGLVVTVQGRGTFVKS
jgi:GntR family transcriptional regulator